MRKKKNDLTVKKPVNDFDEAVVEDVREFVRSVITGVRPSVDSARISQMFFDNMPSDYTSQRARRNTLKAKEKLDGALMLIQGSAVDFDLPQEIYEKVVNDELAIQLRDINEVVEKEICI